MSMKKTGFSDRVIFILGLTLAGVITFVLLAGLIVAVITLCMSSKKRSVELMLDLDSLRSVPSVQVSSENTTLLDNNSDNSEQVK